MTTYSDNIEIIKLSQNGDEDATEKLIQLNYPLAVKIAKKFLGRGIELEDLIQLGLIGMLKAIRTFDTDRGTAFSTYAVPLIMGEIRKFIRDDGLIKVSRENKRNSAILQKCRDEFIERYGVEPNIEELCKISGMSMEDALNALNSSKQVASIYEPLTDDGFSPVNIIEDEEASMEKAFDKIALSEALWKLSSTWRKIIYFRYFKDFSQSETAKILGLSQVKISREEKKIIAELRKSII